MEGVVIIRLPSSEALETVTAFVSAMGDTSVLSLADRRAMALNICKLFSSGSYQERTMTILHVLCAGIGTHQQRLIGCACWLVLKIDRSGVSQSLLVVSWWVRRKFVDLWVSEVVTSRVKGLYSQNKPALFEKYSSFKDVE